MEYFINPAEPLFKDEGDKDRKYLQKYDKGLISFVSTTKVENAYSPLTFTLEAVNDSLSLKDPVAEGIKNILKPVISKLLNTKIKDVEILKRRGYYVFNPITEFGISVYLENPSEIYAKIDLKEFVGYTLLSASSLSRYILHQWEKRGESVLTDLDVKYVSGFALIPIMESLKLLQIETKFDMELTSLETKGYFSYSFNMYNLEDQSLVRDLCHMYNIEIIDSSDMSNWILQTSVPFSTTPQSWIRNNIPLIKRGSYPIFNLYPDWESSSLYKDVILKYIAYMAFAKLSDKYDLISPFIFSTYINEDLSISLKLPTYKLVQEYITIFNSIKNIEYTTVNCDSLIDGVVKRWLVQSIDSNAYPLVLETKDGQNVLVHRSPLAIIYPSPFIFNVETLNKAKGELLNKMQEFYTSCHDNLEPISLDNISEMSLDQLLNLVPITENGITYCFSKENIGQVSTNPMTRRDLSKKVLFKIQNIEWGWRGIFDLGILYGLYADVPSRKKISVDIGLIDYKRLKITAKERELLGNLYNIEVLYVDGKISPLFQICLPTVGLEIVDEMKTEVNRLWLEGFFLNYWTRAVYNFSNSTSLSIFLTDSVLLQAKDSIFDGYKALEYLKEN